MQPLGERAYKPRKFFVALGYALDLTSADSIRNLEVENWLARDLSERNEAGEVLDGRDAIRIRIEVLSGPGEAVLIKNVFVENLGDPLRPACVSGDRPIDSRKMLLHDVSNRGKVVRRQG